MPEPTHVHGFVPGTDPTAVPFVLLHGTGGTEAELVPWANETAPGATKLYIRGTVTTEGGYAFFRRFADRQVDEADIAVRASILAQFIETTCASHKLAGRPIAIGFSNGAIMAAALLMTYPELLAGAVLLRPLSPFAQRLPSPLVGIPVLIIDGAEDNRRSTGDGVRLAGRLRRSGALVTHRLLPGGHAITGEDKRLVREWLGSFTS